MIDISKAWEGEARLALRSFICGHSGCGKNVGAEKGWHHVNSATRRIDAQIYVCPSCKKPNYFEDNGTQVPGIALGNQVKSLPENIETLWEEIRNCCSCGAYISAVLAGRTMLMHIAVEQGAKAGLSFIEYVDYLVSNHYAPPNSKDWVDSIRKHGNEATHEIVTKSKDDASEIVSFLEMLLRFIYEFPARKSSK